MEFDEILRSLPHAFPFRMIDRILDIEKGKRADLVLLEENPLDNITNTRKIAGTMVRGRWYSRSDLDIMLEKVAKDYEGFETIQSLYKIAFWIAISLLSVAVVWFIFRLVRHRKLI